MAPAAASPCACADLNAPLLADGQASHAASRVPSSLRHCRAFNQPPGRLRPLEGPDCLPSSAPVLRTWRVGPGAPSHGSKERCALSPILMRQ